MKYSNIKEFLEKQKPLIDKEIEKLFPRKIDEKWLEFVLGKTRYEFDLSSLNKSMVEPIWEFLDRGGKRWRPALMLLSCEAVGGSIEKAMPFAAMPELIHEGTIIADDIEDNSQERRGKPCLHKIFGVDIALNDSNLMYFLPLILLYKNTAKLDEGTLKRIFDLYSEEMLRVSIGQAIDIYWHKTNSFNVSEEQYLQMCLSKTGVLARFSAVLGGILGKASEEQIKALASFGESLGVAFQIKDDVLNLVPSSKRWGKEIGDDINEGKKTLLVIHALKNSNKKDAERLKEILSMHPENSETIEEAIEIIKKSGAIEHSQEVGERILKESLQKIEKALPENEAKRLLKELADYAFRRDF